MATKKTESHKPTLHRVPIIMDIDMSDFLDEIGSEAKRGGGFKLAKSLIIRALVASMQKVHAKTPINLDGVTSEQEMTERLLEAYKRYKR